MKKYNQSIDLMKFIASIMVIAIHTRPLYDFSPKLEYITNQGIYRVAVPFLFMAAGYFFYQKILSEKNSWLVFIKHIKRIFILYLAWSLIYFPYYFSHSIDRSSHNYWQMFISYLNNFVYFGPYYHLWFFPALIFSISLVYFLSRKIKLKYIIILASFFYLFGLLGDAYSGLIRGSILADVLNILTSWYGPTRNGLCFGFLFVALGAWYAGANIKVKQAKLIIFLFASFYLLVLEAVLIAYFNLALAYNMSIFLVPTTILLFIVVQRLKLKRQFDSLKYRQLSVVMYCVQGFPLIIYFSFYKDYRLPYIHILGFIFVLLTSFLLSVGLRHSNLPIKKYLY